MTAKMPILKVSIQMVFTMFNRTHYLLLMSTVTCQLLDRDGLFFKGDKMDRWTFTEDGMTMRMDLVI